MHTTLSVIDGICGRSVPKEKLDWQQSGKDDTGGFRVWCHFRKKILCLIWLAHTMYRGIESLTGGIMYWKQLIILSVSYIYTINVS